MGSRRERLAKAQRRTSMLVDQLAARAWKHIGPGPMAVAVDDEPRVALLVVNFSTTPYLKLLLLTLGGQQDLHLLHRIVVVDNDSRDGGATFLDALGDRVDRLHVVHRRFRLSHGVGMRAAVRALDRVERRDPRPSNLLLFCDADVVWRDPRALGTLVEAIAEHHAVLAGEVRVGANQQPDIQASFFAVRRDVLARRDVAPLAHDGAPAYRMQRSIWDAGLPVLHIPTNLGGLILHRGRAGVEAAARHHPWHDYARGVANARPHYMGVPGGESIWRQIEASHAALLDAAAEGSLVDRLARDLAPMGGRG
ncbi:MAG: glycosyltransferase [Acidimicrobiales bacterium]